MSDESRPTPPGARTAAVIPAAGRGVRLGPGAPKALRTLNGTPMLVHAVRAMAASRAVSLVVVVAPPDGAAEVKAPPRRPRAARAHRLPGRPRGRVQAGVGEARPGRTAARHRHRPRARRRPPAGPGRHRRRGHRGGTGRARRPWFPRCRSRTPSRRSSRPRRAGEPEPVRGDAGAGTAAGGPDAAGLRARHPRTGPRDGRPTTSPTTRAWSNSWACGSWSCPATRRRSR